MRRTILSLCVIGACAGANADMKSLDNTALQQVNGQAGVDMSLVLRLNQLDATGSAADQVLGTTYANVSTDPRQSLDCTNRQFCRLAMTISGQGATTDTNPWLHDASGNTYWFVMKGLQGYISIPKLSLDALPITYTNTSGAQDSKMALQISLSSANPIKIRHLGFEALAIEKDGNTSSCGANAGKGYLNMCGGTSVSGSETYSNGVYSSGIYGGTAGFDQGREMGFMGLDVHGNMAVNANIAVFSCDGSHPRC